MAAMQRDGPLPVLIAGTGLSGFSLAALLAHEQIPFILSEAKSGREIEQYRIITERSWSYDPLIRALLMGDDGSANAVEEFARGVAVDAPAGGKRRIEARILNAATIEPVSDDVERDDGGMLCVNAGRLYEWLFRRVHDTDLRWQTTVVDIKGDVDAVTVA